MKSFHRLSLVDQTAEHLRERVRSGQWSEKLPGVQPLCEELNVSEATMRSALRKLEAEGLLVSGGHCRSRRVAPQPGVGRPRKSMTVGILTHDSRPVGHPKSWPVHRDSVTLEIQHALEAAGHQVVFAKKSQVELGHSVTRIRQEIAKYPVDTWIVLAGSRELLEWFAGQPIPSIAVYGRTDGLQMARTGPDHLPAILATTRALIALGHRRIVFITLRPRRKPMPGNVERAFLDELEAHGIATGDYNLPDWKESPEGFSELLAELFRNAPPTAMILDGLARYIAALQYLSRIGVRVPDQVSLVCGDYDNALTWCHPAVSHTTWSAAPVIRRIVRWVAAARRGHPDRTQINFPATFIPGGSIGPVDPEREPRS
jgi:DNA-binding LacI/PurR family transcriptional regulator